MPGLAAGATIRAMRRCDPGIAPEEHLTAVLEALRFRGRSTYKIERIPGKAWPELLATLDRAHLTLEFGARCAASLPDDVLSRIDRNLAGNTARHDRLMEEHARLAGALSGRRIEYVVLKGISQWPLYNHDDGRRRPQYDIDIYVPPEGIGAAAQALGELGYEPVNGAADPGADHLPTMIRKTGWTWKNDYYDPAMPPSLELHFRFWNPQRLGMDAGDLAQFWSRRVTQQVRGFEFPALDPVDGLTYSSLHLLRHLLNGDLRLRHVYEIACFLERSADDDRFWSRWRENAVPQCRIAEGIAFRLACEWFHCRLHGEADTAAGQLPHNVRRWFAAFAFSPLRAIDKPNKNELWLHLSLVHGRRDRLRIAARRLFPTHRSRVVRDAHVPAARAGASLAWKRIRYEASFLAQRFLCHVRAVAPTLRGAYLWCSGKR